MTKGEAFIGWIILLALMVAVCGIVVNQDYSGFKCIAIIGVVFFIAIATVGDD
jgi:hypothetical protein